MRSKLVLLVTLSVSGGCLIGTVLAKNQLAGLVAIGIAVLLIAAVVSIAIYSICIPMEQLADVMKRAVRTQRAIDPKWLMVNRRDEIGIVAYQLQRFSSQVHRHSKENRVLRKTLDNRVADATGRATRQLEKLVMRDPLTGLGNRRFLDEQLDLLLDTCRAAKADLIVMAIDIDNFKSVNDTLGHDQGDSILKFIADLIRGCVRSDDIAIRLGGDEFLVLMSGCSGPRAAKIATRIMELLNQHVHTTMSQKVNIGLSFGIASLCKDKPANGRGLIDAADQRLYAAKRAGKSCIHSI